MSAPQFNLESARHARPVTPLPPTAAASEFHKPRRWRRTNRLLPIALIVGAAVIGATTGSVILSLNQTRVQRKQSATTPSLTENQLNSPLKSSNEESAQLEAAPTIAESRSAAAQGSAGEEKQKAVITVPVISSATRDGGGDAALRELPRSAPQESQQSRRVATPPSDHQAPRQEQPEMAAQPSASAESVAAGSAVVRQRRIERQPEEVGQTNHDEQKSQDREKNEGDETAPPQDAREIRRVRELFEGRANNRAKSRRQVDRVTAIFEGSEQR